MGFRGKLSVEKTGESTTKKISRERVTKPKKFKTQWEMSVTG